MPTYVVFLNRKKRHDETLNEYYQAVTLGTLDALNPPQALKMGATTFHQNQITIDVVALRRAPIFQQQVLKQRKPEPKARRTPRPARSAQNRTTSRSRSANLR